MSLNDPRILITKLNELSSELYTWLDVSKDLRGEAQSKQRLFASRVEEVRHTVNIRTDEMENSRKELNQLWHLILRYRDECTHGKDQAQETYQKAQQSLNDAKAAELYCRKQLLAAKAWLQRAQQLLEKAKIALDRAKSELSAAHSALASAEAALRVAHREAANDSQRSCRHEETMIRNAKLDVSKAQQAVNRAQNDVEAAHAEVEKAQKRVSQCEQAVQLANHAVALSHHTCEKATVCYGYAERSLEHVEAAIRAYARAQSSFGRMEDAIECMETKIREAGELVDEDASRSLRDAEDYEDQIHHYTLEANNMLQYSLELLIKFNQDGLSM